jgi:putative copper resistance protein D
LLARAPEFYNRSLPTRSIDWPAIDAVLTGSAIGTAWKVRIIASLIAGATVIRNKWLPLTVLASAAALATLAWTGGGSIDEGTVG